MRKRQSILMLISATVSFLLLFFLYTMDISNISVLSADNCLKIQWSSFFLTRYKTIRIIIQNEEEYKCFDIPSNQNKFIFTDGNHGDLFTVSIFEVGNNSEKLLASDKRLFLNYDQLPNIKTFYIETENGIDPPFSLLKAPEGMWGITVTDNDEIPAQMTVRNDGDILLSANIKINVRGNTSAIGDKQSYKIELNNPSDLLGRGDDYSATEWLLLNDGTHFNNIIGSYFCKILGQEYAPEMEFVNVMINGDWKGLFVLSEGVAPGKHRVNISKNGYIVENDVYWWNEDYFFKTNHQINEMGYTFKYPNDSSLNKQKIKIISEYFQRIEDLVRSHDEKLWEYADIDSFVSWIMVNDVLRQGDGGGSNIFYYIDFSDSDCKLKMGPVWDFGSGLLISGHWFEDENGWAMQHVTDIAWFDRLFEIDGFCNQYKDCWESHYQSLYKDFSRFLDDYLKDNKTNIHLSRDLDAKRYDYELMSVDDEIDKIKKFVYSQIEWIENEIGQS